VVLPDTQILKTTRNEEAVLVAGGMGQSAIVMAAKALLRGGNTIKVCLALVRLTWVYVGEKLRSMRRGGGGSQHAPLWS